MLALVVFSNAQTNRIAYRSHSGNVGVKREGNFGDIGPWYGNMTKKEIDSMVHTDSILRHWYDSINRVEAAGRANAQNSAPAKPKPGKGAAAGAAAASGIVKK